MYRIKSKKLSGKKQLEVSGADKSLDILFLIIPLPLLLLLFLLYKQHVLAVFFSESRVDY